MCLVILFAIFTVSVFNKLFQKDPLIPKAQLSLLHINEKVIQLMTKEGFLLILQKWKSALKKC